jgi:hypothetical protein
MILLDQPGQQFCNPHRQVRSRRRQSVTQPRAYFFTNRPAIARNQALKQLHRHQPWRRLFCSRQFEQKGLTED